MALAIALAAFGCSQGSSQPARPKSLPASAFWVGGADGGVFVDVQPAGAGAARSQYRGTIYHPDGEVWYAGALQLQPATAAPLDLSNKQQFEAWDGTRLLLSGQRVLVARPGKRASPG